MNAAIPGYELTCPAAADLIGALRDILGPRDSELALQRALRELGASGLELAQLDAPQLLALGEALARQRGLAAVLGRSFAIRVASYLELRPLPRSTKEARA